ncbi:energy transducer TonB [Microbulbifer halophilus]|uniref:energy transducer TonB n=1 Tax=Microbulbifer halophilus TaxID=453963 RepID=UPI0036106CCB
MDIAVRLLLSSLLLIASATCAAQYATSAISLRDRDSPPTAYGLEIVRAERWQPDESPAAGPADTDNRLAIDSIANYRARIKAMEIEQGPYATGLPEALTGLAHNYREIGDFDGAVRSFKRAVHLTRIERGPYSRDQLPLLESLRESLFAADRLRELDGLQEYIYRVHREVLEPGDPELHAATRDYIAWHRSAYLRELGNEEERLQTLDKLFESRLSDLRQRDAPPHSLLEPLTDSLKLTYLLGDMSAERLDAFSVQFGRSPLLPHPAMYASAAGESPRQRLRQINYRKGLRLAGELAEAAGEDPETHARALVARGDWYRWHNKRHSARRSYREAYAALGGSEAGEALRRELFASPTELPANRVYRPDIQLEKREPRGRARVRYTVSRNGHPKDLEILEMTPEEDRGARIVLTRLLHAMAFRPRLEDGEPVKTESVEREYVFFDER